MLAGALLTLVLHLPASGQAASPSIKTNEMAAFKATYYAARLCIEADCAQHKTNALAAYGKALAESLQTWKRQGDLNAYLAVQAVQQRFLAEGKVSSTTETNAAVAPFVAQYVASVAEAEDQRDKKLVNLQRTYAVRLECLTKDLMQQNRIEDAKQAQAELARIRAELAFVSAMVETRKDPEPTESKTRVPTEPGSSESKHSTLLLVKRLKTPDDAVTKKEVVHVDNFHEGGTTWYGWPSEIRFVYASQTIEVSIRNSGAASDRMDVECLFFQQKVATEKTSLSSRKKMDVEVKPDGAKVLTFKSPILKSSSDKILVQRKSELLGDKLYGYIVTLSDSNGVFKATASKELEQFLKDKACLAEILAKESLPENLH